MMKEDVRYGNFLIYNDLVREVYGFKPNYIWFEDGECEISKALPIKLTEAWCEQLGGIEIETELSHVISKFKFTENFYVEFWGDEPHVKIDYTNEFYSVFIGHTCWYVHELQNIFFDFNKKPLKTK